MPQQSLPVLTLLSIVTGYAAAAVPTLPDGNLLACKAQDCNDCPTFASSNGEYPSCITYKSLNNLDGYENENGHGYDVWWNSGPPAAGCKIIVRTPASTDLPACGYYLTGWDTAGCWYTQIQQSFMLQYCCGEGACDDASPTTRIADVHAMHLQGIPAITSFSIDNMTAEADNGSRDMGENINVAWRKRTPSSATHQARNAQDLAANKRAREATEAGNARTALERRSPPRKRDCGKYTESEHYTKGGRQQKVSRTKVCNGDASCRTDISTSVTSGRTTSIEAGFDLFEIFSASTSIEFTEEKSRTLTDVYNQPAGTTGYVTYECTRGTLSDCDDEELNDGDDVEGCTPVLLGLGDQQVNDGTYSFVFTT